MKHHFEQSEAYRPCGCETARAALELARPEDESSPDVAQALAHIACCSHCRRIVGHNRRLDEQIGAACRNVTVPDDLRDRLLHALSAASLPRMFSTPEPAVVIAHVARKRIVARRRRFAVLAAGVAAVLFAVLGWLRWETSKSELDGLTLQTVDDGLTSTELVRMDRASFPLPTTMITRSIASGPYRLPDSDAAVYFFSVSTAQGASIEARLLVVRVSHLRNAPTARTFMGGPANYWQGYCTTAWAEGEWSYLCCVKGGQNGLRWLRPTNSPI